jgi:riboflavin synthase
MFTGIVEELGCCAAVEPGAETARLSIAATTVTGDLRPGDSVAVNGVCVTVTSLNDVSFTADLMAETLARTTLGGLRPGDPVNLERPLTLATRLGGHLVQGHVDGVGTAAWRRDGDGYVRIGFTPPAGVARYLVPKGSVAIDGVSLTVVAVDGEAFEVSLIPTTLSQTTLGRLAAGDRVNLEADVIAKYLERLLPGRVDE